MVSITYAINRSLWSNFGRGSARAEPVSSFDLLLIVLIGAIVSGIMMRIR